MFAMRPSSAVVAMVDAPRSQPKCSPPVIAPRSVGHSVAPSFRTSSGVGDEALASLPSSCVVLTTLLQSVVLSLGEEVGEAAPHGSSWVAADQVRDRHSGR